MKFLDYIRGFRKGKEAHGIEQDAMSDPFLADAIEGYDSVRGNHAHRLAQMQKRISGRLISEKRKSGIWKMGIAAAILIAFLGGYFTLMNHQSTMLVAQVQDNAYINIYIPEDYVESKRLELTEMREANPSTKVEATAVVDIANLHELIMPVEKMTIYIPEAYAQLKKEEIEELSLTREKRSKAKDKIFSESASILSDDLASAADYVQDKSIVAQSSQKNVPSMLAVSESPVMDAKPLRMDEVMKTEISSTPYLVTGKVVDDSHEPLIGATVSIKGTDKATITDADGNYSLQVDSKSVDLIANYLGFETIEIPKAKANQVIAMKESNSILEEVVVSGYGTKKKSMDMAASGSVTGRLSKIKITQSAPVIGYKEYEKYLQNNRSKSEITDCKGISGKVVLSFDVDTQGRPVNITVQKSLCEVLDKEAIRLIKQGSDWTQGSVPVEIEVKF